MLRRCACAGMFVSGVLPLPFCQAGNSALHCHKSELESPVSICVCSSSLLSHTATRSAFISYRSRCLLLSGVGVVRELRVTGSCVCVCCSHIYARGARRHGVRPTVGARHSHYDRVVCDEVRCVFCVLCELAHVVCACSVRM